MYRCAGRISRSVSVVAFLTIGSAALAFAGWPSDSTLNLAVATGSADLRFPRVTPDGRGGAYVVWENDGATQYAVSQAYVHHITSYGAMDGGWPVGGIQLNPGHFGGGRPSVCSDGQGGAILAWDDSPNVTTSNVAVQRVDSAGSLRWGSDGVTLPAGGSASLGILADSSHGAIVVVENLLGSGRGAPHNIYAWRVNYAGLVPWPANGVRLCTGNWEQDGEVFTGDGSGGVIVVWVDERGGTGAAAGIYAQHVAGSGDLLWGPTGLLIVSPPASNSGLSPHIADDGNGGAYVAWTDVRLHATGDLYLQHLTATGDVAAGWPVAGLAVDSTNDVPVLGITKADGAGGVILLWRATGLPYPYVGQRIDGDGVRLWGTAARQIDLPYPLLASAATDGHGGLIAIRVDGGIQPCGQGTFVLSSQHISADGDSQWGGNGIALSVTCGSKNDAACCTDDAGGLIAVWEDYRNAPLVSAPPANLYAQHVSAAGLLGGGVVAAELSLVAADAAPGRVSVRWFSGDRALGSASLYRNADGSGWARLGSITPDGTGELDYVDTQVMPGHRYGYRLGIVTGGGEALLGETWVTVPAVAEFALRGAQPNPSGGELDVAFALPDGGAATLEVLDVAGRRVASREVGLLGPGTHVLRVQPMGGPLRPGMYAIRLSNSARTLSTRVIVTN